MTYTVVWKPPAERRLAAIWMDTSNRPAVTLAADTIETLLRSDPTAHGEARHGTTRLLVIAPLAVHYDVQDDDRIVNVLSVRMTPAR
jgi:plasmid stabilization system protein ParE